MNSEIEKIDQKIEKWIDGLIELDNYIDDIKEMEIGKDKKLEIWEKFKEILDDYRNNFMILWKNGEFEKMDQIDELINLVFDKLMKYIYV